MASRLLIAVTAIALTSATTPRADPLPAALADARHLLMGTAPATPSLGIPRGPGRANLCATSEAARRLYPGTGVAAVTRDNPFMPYPEVNGGVCSVYSHASPIERAATFRAPFANCTVSFRNEEGRQVVDVAPRSAGVLDRFALSECFFRLALYIEGYRGALQPSGERLFASTQRGYWAGQVHFVGPIATLIPTRLSMRCPDLKAMYYRDDFAVEATRRCMPAMAGPQPPTS